MSCLKLIGSLSFPKKGGPMTELEKIISRIDSFRDEMIDFQIQLCAIPAIAPASGGEGEVQKAEVLLDFLKKNGFSRCPGRSGIEERDQRHLQKGRESHWNRRRNRCGSVSESQFRSGLLGKAR